MSKSRQEEITELLVAWRSGDDAALAQLIPIVYTRLKRMAASFLQHEREDHTLQPTALVHEAYLRLIQLSRVTWQDRAHFFSICARLMRRVLVEHARYHARKKRGGDAKKVPLEAMRVIPFAPTADVLEVDDAVRDLNKHDPQMAEIAILRYFGGLTRDEIGVALSISARTVSRKLRMTRAWLGRYFLRLERSGGN